MHMWRWSKWNCQITGETAPTGHLLSQNEAFSTGIRLHLTELLAKGAPWDPPNKPSCCQASRLPSTNWQQRPVAEDSTYTTHWTWGTLAGVNTEPSPLHASIFGTGRYSARYHMRNINTKPATNLLIYNSVLPARYSGVIVAHCWSNQPISDLT